MLVPLHGIGSRHDLPLPFGFVVAGASLALVLSFVVLVAAWRQPRFAALGGRPLPRLTRLVDNGGFRATVRIGVLACFGWAALALTAGKDLLTNPVFGFVYVWLWVGLVPLSLLLGTFWRLANPIRTLHRALSAIARVDPDQGLTGLPARIGVWPAAFGVFAFSWLELVQPERATLPVLRLWVLAWLVSMIVGAVVFGQRWIGAADPFEAYASTIAQLAPLRRAGEGLRLVNPLAGLTHWQPPSGTVALVAALLGGTAFDSFTNTTWWLRTVQDSEVAPAVWATGTLLAMIAVVAVTFSAAAAWMARYGGLPWYVYPRAMAGSVVPIVVGYAVAHYATLLVIEGQRTAIGWSDPLGRGWNVFGSARMGVSTSLVDQPTVIALVQLTAIVVGHLVGIVAAHELAVRLLPTRAALRGQLPMLVVMVAYTCAGLVLLFSP